MAYATTPSRNASETLFSTKAQVTPVILLVVAIARAFRFEEEMGTLFFLLQSIAAAIISYGFVVSIRELAGDHSTESYRAVAASFAAGGTICGPWRHYRH